MRVKLWAPSLHGCIMNQRFYAHPMQSIVNFIILMVNLVTVQYHFLIFVPHILELDRQEVETMRIAWQITISADVVCVWVCFCCCCGLLHPKFNSPSLLLLTEVRKFVPRLCNATGTRSSGSSLTVFIFCRFIGSFVCNNVVFFHRGVI